MRGVERRERQEILGEWGVGAETPRGRVERRSLERDLGDSPLAGKPLPRRLRNFRPSVENYVASLGGPLPYMTRLREIEAHTAAHEQALAQAWRELAAACAGDPAAFARRWHRLAAGWSFDVVNDLIDRHNRYFPIEARLPMDVRTRDYVLVNGERYEKHSLTAAWVLERFPPDAGAASFPPSLARESPDASSRRTSAQEPAPAGVSELTEESPRGRRSRAGRRPADEAAAGGPLRDGARE